MKDFKIAGKSERENALITLNEVNYIQLGLSS